MTNELKAKAQSLANADGYIELHDVYSLITEARESMRQECLAALPVTEMEIDRFDTGWNAYDREARTVITNISV